MSSKKRKEKKRNFETWNYHCESVEMKLWVPRLIIIIIMIITIIIMIITIIIIIIIFSATFYTSKCGFPFER